MTKRTRLFIFVSGGILAAGLGTGLVTAYVGGFQNLTLLGASSADELSYLPADATVVAFANVREIMDSELHQKLAGTATRSDHGLARFEEETGVDVTKDVDYVYAALGATEAVEGVPPTPPLVMVRGRFDAVRIEGLVRSKGGQVEDYKGIRLLAVAEPNGGMGGAVAFVEPGLIAMGADAAVRKAIDMHAAGAASVSSNEELMRLVNAANDGNTWVVARFDALTTAGKIPAEMLQKLPAINWLTVTGHVNGGVRAAIRAEARDEASAKNLREVVTGMLALAKLGAGGQQYPELSALVNSIELGGDGTSVSLGVSVPIEVIDRLAGLRTTAEAAPPVTEAPEAPDAPDAPAVTAP